jgi:hypothetical protein
MHGQLHRQRRRISCNTVARTNHIADRIAFHHASCNTWLKAIELGFFTTFPGLTADLVRKYPPHSETTVSGHMDQERSNQRSTKPKNSADEWTTIKKPEPKTTTTAATTSEDLAFFEDSHPTVTSPPAVRTHAIYVSSQPVTGKLYSDATGRFQIPSSMGNHYLLIVYDFDSNCIFAEPMKSRTGAEHLAAYKRVHTLLSSRGLNPQLQKLDNEASTELLQFMQDKGIDYQLVPPHMHRRNAAERAIRTFKNHFIATLCGTDKDFPMHLWDRLLPQALLTLNLLRSSCINPRLSAHAQVHGTFDYNRTPLAPPGTRVLVHEKTSNRETWSPHAVSGYYIGPAFAHYRCYTVYIVETRKERISDTVKFFPQKAFMPIASSTDLAIAAARDLTDALLNPAPATPIAMQDSERQILTQLAEIFTHSLVPLPRVATPVTPPGAENPIPTPMLLPLATPDPPPPPVHFECRCATSEGGRRNTSPS